MGLCLLKVDIYPVKENLGLCHQIYLELSRVISVLTLYLNGISYQLENLLGITRFSFLIWTYAPKLGLGIHE